MIFCVTPEDAQGNDSIATDLEGGSGYHIMGSSKEPDAPFAFNARQTAVCVLPVHFHPVDQFQVWMEGSGKVGGHHVSRGTLHYSDAYTPYGPLVPASEGFAYLTLRPKFDVGYHVLPESRPLLREKMREHRGAQHIVEIDPGQRLPDGLVMLWSRSDGVAMARIDASAHALLHSMPTASNRYYIVMSGSVHFEGRSCPAGTCLWASASETLPSLQAEASGAVVAVLCFASPHR